MIKNQKLIKENWSYFGEVKNGKPHGKGKKIIDLGEGEGKDIYIGDFKNGEYHGKGKLTENVDSSYENFENDLKLIGYWKKGKAVQGKSIYKNGEIYIGEWDELGTPHGKGKKKYPNGDIEEGIFYQGNLHKGSTELVNDRVKFFGERILKKNYDIHEAEFLLTHYSFTVDRKTRHKLDWYGEFKWDKKKFLHGEGILKDTKKTKPTSYFLMIGKFVSGSLEGKGKTIQYRDRNFQQPVWFYIGKYTNGKMHGKGLIFHFPFEFIEKVEMINNEKKIIKKIKMTKDIYKDYVLGSYDILNPKNFFTVN